MSEFSRLTCFVLTLLALVLGGLQFKRVAGAPLVWSPTMTVSGTEHPFRRIPPWDINWWY